MTERSTTLPSTPASGAERLPRCCPRHPDWPTLTQHLVDNFPEVALEDLVEEVRRAKEAVLSTGLTGGEALATGELIARHQLLLIAGRASDIARLDPETHVRG